MFPFWLCGGVVVCCLAVVSVCCLFSMFCFVSVLCVVVLCCIVASFALFYERVVVDMLNIYVCKCVYRVVQACFVLMCVV